ncbi:MAG: M23 family metallopeptidase [Bacilli bacterium]|nr:M23 family metallopeptidase [Bacilli bacterium]
MENDLNLLKDSIKKRRFIIKKEAPKHAHHKYFFKTDKYVFKLFANIIITLTILIGLKTDKNFSSDFYQKVYNSHFSFAFVNETYTKLFGSPIPFSDLFIGETETVFNEVFTYSEASKYKDGVKLTVGTNYLVPSLESGIVIFVGEKEGYGNTVIIKQADNIDIWYCALDKASVSLYDYVTKGTLLGETTEDYLYLVYQENGVNLDYTKYLP